MIGWRDGAGTLRRGSLFAAFAALASGEAWSFPALRPHQREPWHAFTVQVAALALIRAETDKLPVDEAGWRELLLALTDGVAEAWEMVVEDWSKPALLQPPLVTATDRNDLKSRIDTPDALDILAISKNHDVKQQRIATANDQDWLFALVTLQTAQAYGGRSPPEMFFHGVSRMNGGVSTRMTFALRPAGGAGAAFRRDVLRLVALASAEPRRVSDLALLWTLPWDGRESLAMPKLDPLYVEVCRRIRFSRNRDGIVAWSCASHVPRVAQKELNGRTGDPWAPMKADASASHTQTTPLGYRAVTRLLNKKEITLPSLATVHEADDPQGLSIVVAALVRTKGKTEGFHRRAIRTSRMKNIEDYGPAEALDRVGQVAAIRADEAKAASDRLKLAVLALLQGALGEPGLTKRLLIKSQKADKTSYRRADDWIAVFDNAVDRMFFESDFWADAAGDAECPRRAWRERLRSVANNVFEQAKKAAPRTEMRRIRAIARGQTMLDAQMAKWLKEVPDGE